MQLIKRHTFTIQVTPEVINTRGIFLDIPMEETGKGYMSPQEWHEAIKNRSDNDIIIGTLNHKFTTPTNKPSSFTTITVKKQTFATETK